MKCCVSLTVAMAISTLMSSVARADIQAATSAFEQMDFARARKELDAATLVTAPTGYFLLGLMNRDGQGAVANQPEAFFDFTLATMKAGPGMVMDALRERSGSAAKMTWQQILDAERRAAGEGRKGLSDSEFQRRIADLHGQLDACRSRCEPISDRIAAYGPAAVDLIPDLEALMTRDEMWLPRQSYAGALAVIGTAAVPALVRVALDRRQLAAEGPWNMQAALDVLGNMGAVAAAARPAIVTALSDDFDIANAQFNGLYTDLTGAPPSEMLIDVKLRAAITLAQVGDPGREVHDRVAACRDGPGSPTDRLACAAAAGMTYQENDALMREMASALAGGVPSAQALALRLYPSLVDIPATAQAAQALGGTVRTLAGSSSSPVIARNARNALDHVASGPRYDAEQALQEKDYGKAIDKATSVLAINPWSADALRIRAEARRATGDAGGSVSDIRAAAELGDAQAQGDLGDIYASGQDIERDDVQALTWLSIAVVFGNGVASPRRDDLSKRLTAEQQAEAERRVRQWLTSHAGEFPRAVESEVLHLSGLGLDALGAKQYDKALEFYDQALELAPASADVYAGRALVYDDLGRYDDALSDLDKAISLTRQETDQAGYYRRRGEIESEKGDSEQALSDLGKSIDLMPTALALSVRAAVNEAAGRPDDAIHDYQRAIALGAGVRDYGQLAHLLQRKGDFAAVLDICRDALKIDQGYAYCYDVRALAAMSLGRMGDAEAELRKLLAIDPQSYQAHDWLGTLAFMAGHYDEAVSEFDLAVRAAPADPYFAMRLELARRRAGRPSVLQSAAPKLKMNGWPEPLVQLLLGTSDLETVRGKVSSDDQACEFGFYAGEWLLLQGQRDEARPLLAQAARLCPYTFTEWPPAVSELQALH